VGQSQQPARGLRRAVNPLALAVLTLLQERPMHPYEAAATMRERYMDKSVKLNYGALYHTIDVLLGAGLIRPLESERAGRRPERTVYDVTPAGREQLLAWVRELIGQVAKEFPRFEAGLAVIHVLPREEVLELLEDRLEALRLQIETEHTTLARLEHRGVRRLSIVENEYAVAMLEAELAWSLALQRDIASGALAWSTGHIDDDPNGPPALPSGGPA
jgi:DNA-binding PadR family transcriptional regulator